MSLINATDLAKSYGVQDVFQDLSLAVPHRARIALVGPNGIGKTTLLRLLAGLEKADAGVVQRAKRLQIGYLPQEAIYSRSQQETLHQTLWAFCLQAFDELRAKEAELARLEEAMAQPQNVQKAMARYGPLQEAFEREGGYVYPAKIRQVLHGLGFEESEFERELRRFSGGERTRAFLAHLLLEDPDLLILDEPTNHLDIEAVEWLEGWLRDWSGAVVVVSHDRYFLDRLAEIVWELTPDRIEVYSGNYSAYVQQRGERRSYQAARYEAQQEHIQKEQEFIRRNIAGQNTRQAQGRRTRLARLLRDEKVDEPKRARTVAIDFGATRRSGERVLETRDLAIGYADSRELLFEVPDLLLLHGECVALIGPNGAGKTTFLKTLLGQVVPLEGDVKWGASLEVGYFAQAHSELDPDRSVIEELMTTEDDLTRSEARDYLARFLFTGDSVDKRVAALSGGERGRLALAKLGREGANFLLLDEPTNHLDVPSQEILQEALEAFTGTILMISHDRYLIDALSTQIWSVSPSSRELQVFRGGYQAFREAQSEKQQKPAEEAAIERSQSPREARPSPYELEACEQRIAQIETEMDRITRALEASGDDLERVRRLSDHYGALQAELEAQLRRWEELAQSLQAQPDG
jgi:ATP-binding cassette subfamily F protein 3